MRVRAPSTSLFWGSVFVWPLMKLFRHRRPSLKTVLGVTKAKKRLKKELGITALLKPFRWWGNTKRTAKRRIGYESTPWRIARNGVPRPGGCQVSFLTFFAGTLGLFGTAMLASIFCPMA